MDAARDAKKPMVSFTDVTKCYGKGKVPAVDHLNLQVRPGEIFGFLGPNGAGKSTTIKMLVGMLRQDSGSIEVGSFDNLDSSTELKKLLGYVPDEPLFYERMTGLRHINFICDLYGIPGKARESRTLKLAEMFEMTDALRDPINSYSHGMKQKLGVIAALVHDPQVLVLDEPMVGLDPRSSFVLKDVMREFCKMGRTVFFSTHVMEVAERLCDRVGIIAKGHLLFNGTLDELKTQKGETDATLEELFLQLTGQTDIGQVAETTEEVLR
ncbi:MAG: ABC transporter ATP-binding protein [Sphaerochaetaceae bacterium]|nr:ABC transporter ATP-binding protein [Sphaerochaetaceae bacterium]